MNNCLVQYYRCPERYVRLLSKGPLSAAEGYFRFGEGAICYGQCGCGEPSALPTGHLHDAIAGISFEDGATSLPFDPSQIIDNFGREVYINGSNQARTKGGLYPSCTTWYAPFFRWEFASIFSDFISGDGTRYLFRIGRLTARSTPWSSAYCCYR